MVACQRGGGAVWLISSRSAVRRFRLWYGQACALPGSVCMGSSVWTLTEMGRLAGPLTLVGWNRLAGLPMCARDCLQFQGLTIACTRAPKEIFFFQAANMRYLLTQPIRIQRRNSAEKLRLALLCSKLPTFCPPLWCRLRWFNREGGLRGT